MYDNHNSNSIPYAVEPNAVTVAAMETAERDEDMYGPFDSVDALIKALEE